MKISTKEQSVTYLIRHLIFVRSVVWPFLLWFMGFNTYVQGQTQKSIDSLEQEALKDNTAILACYELAELYIAVDSTKAFLWANKGLERARKSGDAFKIGKGNFTLGGLNLDYNYPLKAERYYKAADTILSRLIRRDSAKAHLKLWVRANFNIGVARSYQGISEDIKYLEKITPVAEKIGFYRILAIANTNLGINFYNSQQLEKAYKYFKRSGSQYEKLDDNSTYLEDRFIFTACLVEMDSLKTARSILDKIETLMDTVQNKQKLQMYHMTLGQYYFGTKEYNNSISNFKIAEELLTNNQVVRNDLQLKLDFMETYAAMEAYDNAIKYAEQALDLIALNNNKIIAAEVYKQLSNYHENLGNSQKAFENLKNYVVISDSLNIADLEKEVNRLESKFQSEKKEREILELTNENSKVELQLTAKKSQNYLLLLISLGLLFLGSLAYVGFRNFKRRDQLKAIEIAELKYEQESQLYNAMLDGQEKERQRLSIDLHDGLAGRLSALKMNLEKLAKKAETKKTENNYRSVAKLIDSSLYELRSIARNLMPETLFKFGIESAVKDYCSSISPGEKQLNFIVQFYDTEVRLNQNMNLTLYRIIQELVNNAIKHAEATEVLVQYLIDDNKVNITVEDNGIGFKINAEESHRGMGLNNLKTRVAYLNGDMDFETAPGQGTNVHIVIPI